MGGMQPEVRKICCPGNATTRGQKKGKIAFAYPVEYPRRMTDRGMYAKISAYRDGLNHVATAPSVLPLPLLSPLPLFAAASLAATTVVAAVASAAVSAAATAAMTPLLLLCSRRLCHWRRRRCFCRRHHRHDAAATAGAPLPLLAITAVFASAAVVVVVVVVAVAVVSVVVSLSPPLSPPPPPSLALPPPSLCPCRHQRCRRCHYRHNDISVVANARHGFAPSLYVDCCLLSDVVCICRCNCCHQRDIRQRFRHQHSLLCQYCLHRCDNPHLQIGRRQQRT